MENRIRERIIEALKRNKQGLTILEIAKALAVNRITASKYVYGLLAEDIVLQRIVGPAKLCCLNPAYLELENSDKNEVEPDVVSAQIPDINLA